MVEHGEDGYAGECTRMSRLRAWFSVLRSGPLLTAVVLALLTGVCVVLFLALSDIGKLKDIAAFAQSVVTAIAIVVGGIFAYHKLQVFRTFEPHLTISHKVSHRTIGDSYVHIDAAATLHNSSKVKIELLKGFFRLQQVVPVSDAEVESLYAHLLGGQDYKDIQWPTLYEVQRAWDKDELVVEPGEAHQEAHEFIVSIDIESVIIYTYFYNPNSSTPQGWGATTVYDIVRRD